MIPSTGLKRSDAAAERLAEERKPTLYLLEGKRLTAESLAALYKKLTGKDTDEAGLAWIRERLSKLPQFKDASDDNE